ncbi:mitochondrial 54S ribosomal protein bL17m [Ascoidea rubescens DSM 1968]|uniref:Ribosomal protein L17 n=1 Tax=Ascoidea rubescens DSM 1968 TaxID=1344418 RepID=A0A1D2VFV9_9ASCO|nr:ribosomal protein L17 [Ascoidea rubescens DSM 1968]ODV60462.1 ribosomal protein L17 [Ascoidea rubescens DSM 1968]
MGLIRRSLSRRPEHRRALLRNLMTSLIENESIFTTHTKAKETQKYMEKIIGIAKRGKYDHKNERIAKTLVGRDLFKLKTTIPKLFDCILPRYKDRQGGYTRILKIENRLGDNAPQSIIEFVDGKREMKYWLTARIAARFQLQKTPYNNITKENIKKILSFKGKNAEKQFQKDVDLMKKEFYSTPESLEVLPFEATQKRIPSRKSHKNIVYVTRPTPQNLDVNKVD